ncbi:MAG: heat shock protein Hsp20 [Planctomycetaceae bacterium]|nr:heat shock protein Hsp20 [Planctomycetaceae bacterium]
MAVFRWRQSWGNLRDLEREFDRLLESIKVPFPGLRLERQYPPVNVYELDQEFLLVAELPGIIPENLELTVAAGILTLKGERRGPEGVPDDRFRRHERLRGNWARQLTLPDRVDEERLSAEFVNGVLKIHLPKLPAVKPRQIPVVGGES